jgi:hypothetical protein
MRSVLKIEDDQDLNKSPIAIKCNVYVLLQMVRLIIDSSIIVDNYNPLHFNNSLASRTQWCNILGRPAINKVINGKIICKG